MDPYAHLMLTPDSLALVDIATDLALPVVAAHGLAGLTPAAVATQARCTRQAVHQWFGSRTGLQRAVAGRFVARWTRWQEIRAHFHGLPALLPDGEPVLGWTRVWLALLEAAHRDPAVAEVVDHARVQERLVVARALRSGGSGAPGGSGATGGSGGVGGSGAPGTLVVHALVEGLRLQLASGGNPTLDWSDAAGVLRSVIPADPARESPDPPHRRLA